MSKKENVIDTTNMLPEERLNVLLLLLDSALPDCGFDKDFILLCNNDGKWSAHSTIQDEARMRAVLRGCSEGVNVKNKEVRVLNMRDYSVEVQEKRTKQ